jgi:competence protein ComEC
VPTRVVPPGWPPAHWSLVMCDVGQGDGLVLATGEPGRAVLVDVGPEAGAIDVCLARLGVTSLALVVLTHLHADHVGGLAGALSGRAVGGIALGPARDPADTLTQVIGRSAAARAPVVGLARGTVLRWPGLVLEVLGPVRPTVHVDGEDGSAVNDTSVVLRAHTPIGRVLLPGDAELSAQSALLGSGADLHAEILKVPHHGSRSSSPTFLTAVHASLALVSVGRGNTYGHPNPGVMGLLARTGALVRRTDESGDLAVVAGGAGGAGGDGSVARAGPVVVARGDPRPDPRRR